MSLRFMVLATTLLSSFSALAQTGQPVSGAAINTTTCMTSSPQNCTIWTPAQWVSAWASKQDVLGFTPYDAANPAGYVNVAGAASSIYCPGIKADGTTDDTAALAACKAAAPAGSVVRLPHGDMHLTSFPTGSNQLIWVNNGTTFNGNTPLQGIGNDVVESIINGGKWITRQATVADPGPMVRIDQTYNFSGGTSGFTAAAVAAHCTLPSGLPALNDYVWCNRNILTTSAIGPGQHVALTGSTFRPSNALSDGQGRRAQTWGGYFENNDQTGSSSDVSGSMVGVENDIYANGGDPGSNGDFGDRIVLQMNAGLSNTGGSDARIGHGIVLGTNNGVHAYYGRGVNIRASWDTAAIDTSLGAPLASTVAGSTPQGAPAIRIGNGQSIDITGDGVHTLAYAGSALSYAVSGVTKAAIDDSGNTTVQGSLKVAGGASNTLNVTWASGGNVYTIVPNAAANLTLSASGAGVMKLVSPVMVGAMQLASSTVASLPTCNAGLTGAMYEATDLSAPTYNGTLTGGGAVKRPVSCNGTAWVS